MKTYRVTLIAEAATVRNCRDEADALAKLHDAYDFNDAHIVSVEPVDPDCV